MTDTLNELSLGSLFGNGEDRKKSKETKQAVAALMKKWRSSGMEPTVENLHKFFAGLKSNGGNPYFSNDHLRAAWTASGLVGADQPNPADATEPKKEEGGVDKDTLEAVLATFPPKHIAGLRKMKEKGKIKIGAGGKLEFAPDLDDKQKAALENLMLKIGKALKNKSKKKEASA